GLIAWLVKPVMDDIFIRRDSLMLKLIPLALLAVYVVKGLARYLQANLMASVGERVVARLRRELYTHIQSMPLAFFSDVHSADLMSRMLTDVARLARLSSGVLVMAVRQLGTIAPLALPERRPAIDRVGRARLPHPGPAARDHRPPRSHAARDVHPHPRLRAGGLPLRGRRRDDAEGDRARGPEGRGRRVRRHVGRR